MARSDLIVALIQAGAQQDESAFRRTAEAILNEERAKNHYRLAAEIEAALVPARPEFFSRHTRKSMQQNNGSSLFHFEEPETRLADLSLTELTRSAVIGLIQEQRRFELLRSYGLEPRNRLLFVGPPGGGKTTLASAIASELYVPLLTVRYEGLIGSFLGETASRLDELFQHVSARPCVLFFDEFDAVAKERGDTHETGEIKRVVSSLLLQIDRLPSHVIVAAATNHPELLDRAVWRRMQVTVELPNPSRQARILWLSNWSKKHNMNFGLSLRTIADRLDGVSYSELEQFSFDVLRSTILGESESGAREIVQETLAHWNVKLRGGSSAGNR